MAGKLSAVVLGLAKPQLSFHERSLSGDVGGASPEVLLCEPPSGKGVGDPARATSLSNSATGTEIALGVGSA